MVLNLGTLKSVSEIRWKFLNVVLEKDCFTLEDRLDRLSLNVCNQLPINAAQNPRRANISRMENVNLTNRVKSEEVSQKLKVQRNILHTVTRRKGNWIGHVLRRNCLVKRVLEGKIEGTGRRGRRRKQLLDGFKKTRRYWKLKEEVLDRNFWRTRCWRSYLPVLRQTTWLWDFNFILPSTPPSAMWFSD